MTGQATFLLSHTYNSNYHGCCYLMLKLMNVKGFIRDYFMMFGSRSHALTILGSKVDMKTASGFVMCAHIRLGMVAI